LAFVPVTYYCFRIYQRIALRRFNQKELEYLHV
jgi:hypothetical protein